MVSFDPNKRGLFHVVRSQNYAVGPETMQERQESIYAVLAVGIILMVTLAFLVLYLLERGNS